MPYDFRDAIFIIWNKNVSMIVISLFSGIEGHAAPNINPGPGYNTLLLRLNPGDLYVRVPINCSIHYSVLFTVRLHCQTPTLMRACHLYDGILCDPTRTWTYDLQQRRTRYTLSHIDAMQRNKIIYNFDSVVKICVIQNITSTSLKVVIDIFKSNKFKSYSFMWSHNDRWIEKNSLYCELV